MRVPKIVHFVYGPAPQTESLGPVRFVRVWERPRDDRARRELTDVHGGLLIPLPELPRW